MCYRHCTDNCIKNPITEQEKELHWSVSINLSKKLHMRTNLVAILKITLNANLLDNKNKCKLHEKIMNIISTFTCLQNVLMSKNLI